MVEPSKSHDANPPTRVQLRDVTSLTPLSVGALISGFVGAFMAISDKFNWALFLLVIILCTGTAFVIRPPVTVTVDEWQVVSRSLWRTIPLPITGIDLVEKVWVPKSGPFLHISDGDVSICVYTPEPDTRPFRRALGRRLDAVNSPVMSRPDVRELLAVDEV